MTKRYVAYTLGDIKGQHAHASPVYKLMSARKREGSARWLANTCIVIENTIVNRGQIYLKIKNPKSAKT